MTDQLKKRLSKAVDTDSEILSARDKVQDTLGSDKNYLYSLGLTKADLMKLEKKGLAVKARYATRGKKYFLMPDGSKVDITGPHRTRWIIFSEAIYDLPGV